MSNQRLPIVLCIINFVFLIVLLWHRGSLSADGVAQVVRCRTLQVVDDQGRVRSSIQVLPAGTFKPTGKEYPETVIFRLIDAEGRPEVKIVGSVQGGAIGLVGEKDETQVQLEAQNSESLLRLKNKDGKQQEVKP